MITAKVKCVSKTDSGQATESPQCSISFLPDYQDGRNAEWAAATPTLSLSMTVRADVADRFEVGGAYTLVFEPDGE